MTDDLERDLRDLLRRRADTIGAADLPAWSPPDPTSSDRRRSFGPLLAAAAAVVLVAAVLTAVIHDQTGGTGSGGSEGQANGPGVAAPPKLPAAPTGTRAVSSLGIQLLVPDLWRSSSPCDGTVVHPGPPGMQGLPVYSCPTRPTDNPADQVSILPGVSTQFPCSKSVARLSIAGRTVCIASSTSGAGTTYGFSTSIPVPVTVTVTSSDRDEALAVLRSARSVDPDAYGCPVRPDRTVSGSMLSAAAVTLSVCAYDTVAGAARLPVLTTSGAANGDAAGILAGALVNDASNGTPASCSVTKDVTGRLVVTSRDRAGRTGSVVLMALPCGGLAFVGADGHARLLAVSTKQLLAGALN